MESPRRPSAASASVPTSCLSDSSFSRPDSPLQRPNDSFAESQQCSADPSAFLGFHVPPSAEEVEVEPAHLQQKQKQTPKLVLNLDATTRGDNGFRPATSYESSIRTSNPFSELFEGDTQDDENVVIDQVAGERRGELVQKNMKEVLPLKRRRQREDDAGADRSSPPPTMLASMESAWRARKRRVAESSLDLKGSTGEVDAAQNQNGQKDVQESLDAETMDEARKFAAATDATVSQESAGGKRADDSLPGASACSEYSEDLAPRIFQAMVKVPTNESIIHENCGKNSTDHVQFDTSAMSEDSDRETDYEDELECTQQLDDDGAIDDMDMTRSYEIGSDCDEEDTEVYPYSDTGTLPYGADSTILDDGNDDEANPQKETAGSASREEKMTLVPTPDQISDQRRAEDEATSREGSQTTQQDYLTPRVVPSRSKRSDAAETSTNFVVAVAPSGDDEQSSQKSQHDNDPDECVPTQPSKPRAESEPIVEPNLPSQQNVSKKSDVLLTNEHLAGTDSQAKAIRTLEFSFSMPESQEGEPHFSASLPSEGAAVSKRSETFSRSDKTSPFASSISPVWAAIPTPIPVEGSAVPDVTGVTISLKKKTTSPCDLPTGKKQKHSAEGTDSPSSSKPKRSKRGFFTPDSSSTPKESDGGDPQTPRPPARRGTRSSQSTPSSTPTVRTRTRTLTPVPSQRAYASRSRTLFKYKFEFCLTGFVKTGEENLKELIEGHGGKIPERYQDVLYKNNVKAVVIATPVSWRKRKFMQAVACGIPVVHTDWIHDCIEDGYVVPFDGYQVPTGYSVTTRKFECFPPRELHIFEGYSFGIVSDVAQTSKAEAKDKANLMAFILKACGADAVYENLSTKSDVNVDVVLCDEYTQTCRYYKKKRRVPVKDFQWVTECMILQRCLDPEEPVFEPQRVGCVDVFAASAEIGDSDNTTLKLYTGELVMADISGSAADHYLLFNVCEILSIHVNARKDEGSQSKRKDKGSRVMLRVGMLKREPYNPELSKSPANVLEISSSQVKRRVVAISKEDYGKLKYKDESIFYLEEESDLNKLAVSEHRWLTQ
ncbi:hypothetical protein PRIC2_006931 [Phytophthora ramorum]